MREKGPPIVSSAREQSVEASSWVSVPVCQSLTQIHDNPTADRWRFPPTVTAFGGIACPHSLGDGIVSAALVSRNVEGGLGGVVVDGGAVVVVGCESG